MSAWKQPLEPLLTWLAECWPEAVPLVVGGSVRDLMRGEQPRDLDVEVLGVERQALLASLPFPWREVGRSFSHLLVQLPGSPEWLELSSEPGPPGSDLDAHWARLATRRDFTCNAMAWHLAQDRLIDPFAGREDIAQRQLRLAAPDSLQRDPLRVLRAAGFCARFGWRPEAETGNRLRQAAAQLSGVARERISREWEKLLLRPAQPGEALQWLREWGALDPELHALEGCPQDPEHHPEGDVWTHTILTLNAAARLSAELAAPEALIVRLGALLHDLGKPSTTRLEESRWRALGHEKAGVEPASAWLGRLTFPQSTVESVLACVRHHMRPPLLLHDLNKGRLSTSQIVNALRRLLRDVAPCPWPLFFLVCEADARGRGRQLERYQPAEVLIPLIQANPVEQLAARPLLQGRDLMQARLPIAPGPAMGAWLSRVEEARDRDEVTTPQEALDWLRRQLGAEVNDPPAL